MDNSATQHWQAHIYIDNKYGIRAVLRSNSKVIELAHIDPGVSARINTFINTRNNCKSSRMIRYMTSRFYRHMRDVNHCVSRDVVQCIASCMDTHRIDKVIMDDIDTVDLNDLGIWSVWNYAQLASYISYKLAAATGLTLHVEDVGYDE